MKKGENNADALWRDEFSIDLAEEQYVNRRQFSKFLVLTSMGMFAGQIWILVRNWFRPAPVYPEKAIGSASAIGVGDVKLFSYPEELDPCILIRRSEDEFVAFSQKCTHLSCAVYFEKQSNRLECPCHEGYFSVEDGSVLQGPPPRPLPRVLLRKDGDVLIATGMQS